MALYQEDKIKLQALKYAEKRKIVNQKTIEAFIDGFKFRDSADSDLNLTDIEKKFRSNYDSWETDCGYCDLRNEQYQQRKLEGYEAKKIADEIKSIKGKIFEFNNKFKREL